MVGQGNFSTTRRRPRPAIIVLIVLLHIVGLYLLARAFAPAAIQSVERQVISAVTVTVKTQEFEAEPEPEPDEGAQGDPGREAVPKPVTAPSPKQRIQTPTPAPQASSTGRENTSGARETGEGTGAAGSGPGTGSGRGGGGQGGGIATKPSVRSGQINTARDFPVPEGGRQTRFGKSVTVHFTVTTDGRARNCSVASSGVDAETTARVCPLVVERIRFNPATRADGTAVEARYGYRVQFTERR